MKVAFFRTRTDSTVFLDEKLTDHELDEASLKQMKISSKGSSKSIILGLKKCGFITECEEWKFWTGPFQEVAFPGQMPVKLFPCNERITLDGLARYIRATRQPDMLWAEGHDYPPYLRHIFELCPNSFRIVYSKNYRPWKIEGLDQYDLCLVDEEWQVAKVGNLYPAVHCAVWDKLIDYGTTHYPMPCEKIYDVCYVAYLRGPKNHELLFRAMAKLKDRKLTCVCVGGDRQGNRVTLEKMVVDLNLSVQFTGEVPKEDVNRYVNQAKIGVVCSKLDGAPRAILEYMAADVPVLVNAELLAGTRYVGAAAGLVRSPEEFHTGIAELLDNGQNYSPRAYFLEHYAREKVMARFVGILEDAGYNIANAS